MADNCHLYQHFEAQNQRATILRIYPPEGLTLHTNGNFAPSKTDQKPQKPSLANSGRD